ncbi:MAG: DUF4097 family beta strand repeat-containing protein, partial [Balneolaceae bacterium]|nr:DUF4097 family beta strand repeat-containing protein [Balneolaceae bacterium]
LFKITLAFLLPFLWVMAMVVNASASSLNGTTQNEDPYRVEQFSFEGRGNLEVQTSGGHITVEGSKSNNVRVEMYVRKNGRYLTSADIDLDKYEIDISKSGNTVHAIARRKDRDNWRLWNNNNISISFKVYTPREISADLRTSGGHISVNGLDGNQNVRTSGGHLELMNLKGTVEARTSGGHIEIADFSGRMTARTSGGHINLAHAEGDIEVRTSGGHISLDNTSGTVSARTSGGSINADLQSIGRYVELRTSGGHVKVNVPGGIGLDLDLKGSRVKTKLQNFSGEVEHDEVQGSINGGGPRLTARTSGGTVSISFY